MTEFKNFDEKEINKFDDVAQIWWDPKGEMGTLHTINPLRTKFITETITVESPKILDVGCGGGILSEALAKTGAQVTGIDLSEPSIDAARQHSQHQGLEIDYRVTSAEDIAQSQPGSFDVVTCMEMLEHVPDPGSIIKACAQLVKPGGLVFFSTLNRKPKAYLLAIVAAEHVLKMLPKGTHDFKTFIKPSELSRTARSAGLELKGMVGIEYNPFTKRFSLGKDIDVNYIAAFKRPE